MRKLKTKYCCCSLSSAGELGSTMFNEFAECVCFPVVATVKLSVCAYRRIEVINSCLKVFQL